MTVRLCATCAVEQPGEGSLPAVCPICADERQYVPPSGQVWTTLDELTRAGRQGVLTELEPGITGITIEPQVGIGQTSLLVATPAGNLLWEPSGYVDDRLAAQVAERGGVAAIASSHPHMFGVQLEWSRRFADAPVHVAAADREWLQRGGDAVRFWDDRTEVLPGVVLHRIGGHFPGSAVASLRDADGRGLLLSGDTVLVTPDRWCTFQRSYPNHLPLSAAVVGRIADALGALRFARLIDNFGQQIREDAGAVVQRSAARYIRWVRGDFDDRT
ncbi:MBL fold metallo-hydrolase [Amnibacterium sp. CER49]|uniref:MBL fold metallo-hydrolase n=1 Tax=Amnibacterium sp. CER49 TaxID=3039161 RepID=UPI002446DDE8|nr:MBL fold metallo-hydrolase [Amnibacterium sp. CER49]MDH2443727.1 MBL fold metallo-hydrolase [Amnibacterium sp. CER49]